MENQQPQDAPSIDMEMPVKFAVTVGEVSGLFGAINTTPFQSMMMPLADKINKQISAHNIPSYQTRQEIFATSVNLTLTINEINSIFSVVNSTNFSTILKPVLDSITEQVQSFVSTVSTPPAQAQENNQPMATLPGLTPLSQMPS